MTLTNPDLSTQIDEILSNSHNGICDHGAYYMKPLELKQAVLALVKATHKEARADELQQFVDAVKARLDQETWESWGWRVLDYLKVRAKALNGDDNV